METSERVKFVRLRRRASSTSSVPQRSLPNRQTKSAIDRPDTRDFTVVVDTVHLTLSATVTQDMLLPKPRGGKTADICTIADINNMADESNSVQIRQPKSAFDRPDTRDLTVVVDTVYLTLSATVRPKIHRIFCCRSREAGKTADICTIADNNMADVLISVQIRNYMVHRTHPQAHRATVWSRLLRINSWHKN